MSPSAPAARMAMSRALPLSALLGLLCLSCLSPLSAVVAQPTITTQPDALLVMNVGESTAIQTVASADGVSAQWYYKSSSAVWDTNWNIIGGATNFYYNINNVVKTMSDRVYRARVCDGAATPACTLTTESRLVVKYAENTCPWTKYWTPTQLATYINTQGNAVTGPYITDFAVDATGTYVYVLRGPTVSRSVVSTGAIDISWSGFSGTVDNSNADNKYRTYSNVAQAFDWLVIDPTSTWLYVWCNGRKIILRFAVSNGAQDTTFAISMGLRPDGNSDMTFIRRMLMHPAGTHILTASNSYPPALIRIPIAAGTSSFLTVTTSGPGSQWIYLPGWPNNKQLHGLAFSPDASKLYLSTQYDYTVPGHPLFSIQRFDMATLTLDSYQFHPAAYRPYQIAVDANWVYASETGLTRRWSLTTGAQDLNFLVSPLDGSMGLAVFTDANAVPNLLGVAALGYLNNDYLAVMKTLDFTCEAVPPDAPVITQQPTLPIFTAATNAPFSLTTASSTAGATVQWYNSFDYGNSWVVANGETSTTYQPGVVSSTYNGRPYKATWTAPNGKTWDTNVVTFQLFDMASTCPVAAGAPSTSLYKAIATTQYLRDPRDVADHTISTNYIWWHRRHIVGRSFLSSGLVDTTWSVDIGYLTGNNWLASIAVSPDEKYVYGYFQVPLITRINVATRTVEWETWQRTVNGRYGSALALSEDGAWLFGGFGSPYYLWRFNATAPGIVAGVEADLLTYPGNTWIPGMSVNGDYLYYSYSDGNGVNQVGRVVISTWQLDNSFGSGGLVALPANTQPRIAVSNNWIYTTQATSIYVAIRLNYAGVQDPNFAIGSLNTGGKLALSPNRRILFAGAQMMQDWLVGLAVDYNCSSAAGTMAIGYHPFATFSQVVGDPQFSGLRGQSYQIHGIPGTVYNLISSAELQVNGLFTFLAQGVCPPKAPLGCWSHPGTFISDVGAQMLLHAKPEVEAADSQRVVRAQFLAGSWQDGLEAYVGGERVFAPEGDNPPVLDLATGEWVAFDEFQRGFDAFVRSATVVSLSGGSGAPEMEQDGWRNSTLLSDEELEAKRAAAPRHHHDTADLAVRHALRVVGNHTVVLYTPSFTMKLVNSDHFFNQEVDYRQLQASKRSSPVRPHGLLGQTSELRRYQNKWRYIAGDVSEYAVDGPFGCEFTYNRFPCKLAQEAENAEEEQ